MHAFKRLFSVKLRKKTLLSFSLGRQKNNMSQIADFFLSESKSDLGKIPTAAFLCGPVIFAEKYNVTGPIWQR